MAAIQPFIRDRRTKDGVSNATVNRALEVVRRILNVAHQDWRSLRGVPKIRMLKEPRRRVRFLRRDEADRLMATLPSHMKPIVQFALATGCRAGEIHGLGSLTRWCCAMHTWRRRNSAPWPVASNGNRSWI
jgi:integrase